MEINDKIEWTFVTFEVMKYLRINNISIHINFYQNRFINECYRKIKSKIPEFHIFLVRCRRTYVLNNKYTFKVRYSVIYIVILLKYKIILSLDTSKTLPCFFKKKKFQFIISFLIPASIYKWLKKYNVWTF